MNLIEYDKKYEAAMHQVFGAVFIADDQATARKISLDNNSVARFNCCTLKGDMYRSDGILTGGHSGSTIQIEKLHDYIKEVESIEAQQKDA